MCAESGSLRMHVRIYVRIYVSTREYLRHEGGAADSVCVCVYVRMCMCTCGMTVGGAAFMAGKATEEEAVVGCLIGEWGIGMWG